MAISDHAHPEKRPLRSQAPAAEPATPSPDVEKDNIEVVDQRASDKRLLRRLDRRVIPPLFILYFMSFLDRSNIGNAKIQGIETSLGMEGQDYGIALFVFFITYILCEVPSNLILKKVAPSTWLSVISTCWGMSLPPPRSPSWQTATPFDV